jgi:tRNA U34 5-carboxymethylaminomethyl modifying GTPase MnmE/TrmE
MNFYFRLEHTQQLWEIWSWACLSTTNLLIQVEIYSDFDEEEDEEMDSEKLRIRTMKQTNYIKAYVLRQSKQEK